MVRERGRKRGTERKELRGDRRKENDMLEAVNKSMKAKKIEIERVRHKAVGRKPRNRRNRKKRELEKKRWGNKMERKEGGRKK